MDFRNLKLSFSSLLKDHFSKKGASYLFYKRQKCSWHLFLVVVLVANGARADGYRIVSLSPAITEILFELDLGKDIVGTTTFSDFPEAAKKIPTVGSYFKPSIEKIIRLKPTHVLVFKEGDPSIWESLNKAHVNYISFDSKTLSDFENLVEAIGDTFNVEKKAQEILKMWKDQWAMLDSSPKTSKKILIQIDHNPLFIAAGDTFLSEALKKCGAQNVFENLNGYKKVQAESVFNRKPEIILVVGQLNELDSFESVKNFWKNNPITKNSSVIKGNPDVLSRLSTRLPSAISKICNEMRAL